MDAALPIVATRVGGLPEMVVDGETRLLVAAGRRRALADRDRRAARRPERRVASSASAAVSAAGERYGIDAWVARIEALYDELLGPPPP